MGPMQLKLTAEPVEGKVGYMHMLWLGKLIKRKKKVGVILMQTKNHPTWMEC